MKILPYLASLILVLLMSSCKKEGLVKKDVKGEWNITSYSYVGNDGNDYEYLGTTTGEEATYYTRMMLSFSNRSFVLEQYIEAVQDGEVIEEIPLSTFWGLWELNNELSEITLFYGMDDEELLIYDGTSLANFLASNTEIDEEAYLVTNPDDGRLILETTIKGLDFRIEAERME